MEPSCRSCGAISSLLLTMISQITLSTALPFESRNESSEASPLARFRPHHVLVPATDTQGLAELSPSPTLSAAYWQPTYTAYQIPDGQVQVWTQAMPVTADSTTYTTTITGTRSWHGASPCPSPAGEEFTAIPSSPGNLFEMSLSLASSSLLSSSASGFGMSLPLAPATTLPGADSPTVSLNDLSVTTTSTQTSTLTASLTTTLSTLLSPRVATPSVPDTDLISLSILATQTASKTVPTFTAGTVISSLETSGNPSVLPFPTSIVTAATSLSLVDTGTLSSLQPTAPFSAESVVANDVFQPLATEAPPSQISSRGDHPVPRTGIQPQSRRLQTNRFYANFFLGSQTAATFTHPYSVSWVNGAGGLESYGMAISHTERNVLATGATNEVGAWSFYANPIGIRSLILSATELGQGTRLTTDSLQAFKVNVNLVARGRTGPTIKFPMVQGMGFVTALYNFGTPLVQSGVSINTLAYVGAIGSATYKYRFSLNDGNTWLLYVTPRSSDYSVNSFTLLNPNTVQGPSGFNGYLQVAKVPRGASDAINVYDDAAGAYPTAARLSGSVDRTTGRYTFSFTKSGVQSRSLLMWALPHHVESFDSTTRQRLTNLRLISTTKGTMTAVRAASWSFMEPDLPASMGFAPWSPSQGSITAISDEARRAIDAAGASELRQNLEDQSNLNSMYYSGKALAKFAGIVYTLYDLSDNKTLALTGLQRLQTAFARFVNNRQQFPLVYDSAWGGVVSSATYVTGDTGADFGGSLYNDHHFHYSYFVYAAAVIGSIDPAWLDQGTNKDWVNMLVRDYANSVHNDPYFPFSRSFDWFHGHSWAKGLFESADGKDEESSSEDALSIYAIKLWGHTIGDKNLEARGNLMLAVQARSLRNYFLYESSNTVQPAQFIGNKVSGILFENKIDHTTYFGGDPEYVQGIHMLPLLPFSTYTRSQQFVREEWNTWFSNGRVNNVSGGWRGILMANLAIIDPVASYNFFSGATGEFSQDFLDGGASQTWYLAWSAALGGSPGYRSKARNAPETPVDVGRAHLRQGRWEESGNSGGRLN